jgi:hypothetical protein
MEISYNNVHKGSIHIDGFIVLHAIFFLNEQHSTSATQTIHHDAYNTSSLIMFWLSLRPPIVGEKHHHPLMHCTIL